MLELILGILLAAGAIYFVLLPILRPPVESASDAELGDEGEDPADDMSPQTVALRALKEIEFDRATGKLSDSDYEQLKGKYTQEALAAGVFGAPSFVLPSGEIFWGQDRLEMLERALKMLA